MASDRAIAQAWRELQMFATRHTRADEFASSIQQRAAELDATPPAGAGEAVLPAAAEPITERAVGLPTVAVGDWIIPTGDGSCRVVDARMAYGWNECRDEMRERLAKLAAPTPLPEADRARETSRRQAAVEKLLAEGFDWRDGRWVNTRKPLPEAVRELVADWRRRADRVEKKYANADVDFDYEQGLRNCADELDAALRAISGEKV